MDTAPIRPSLPRWLRIWQLDYLKEHEVAIWFLAPTLLILLLLILGPMFYALYLSVNDVSLVGGEISYKFVGLKNYLAFLEDERLGIAVFQTLQFTILRVGLSFVVALFVALVLNK